MNKLLWKRLKYFLIVLAVQTAIFGIIVLFMMMTPA